MDKYFNTQRLKSIEDLEYFDDEGLIADLTSFQRLLIKIRDPSIKQSKGLSAILINFPEFIAQEVYCNYYAGKQPLLTYEDCLIARELFVQKHIEKALVDEVKKIS